MGAINRDQLRKSITSLFSHRLQLKRICNQIDNLKTWLPGIKDIYEGFEEAGYDQDEIIKIMKKKKKLFKPIGEQQDETFYDVAKKLRAKDEEKGAWINEDPEWRELAEDLKRKEDAHGGSSSLPPGVGIGGSTIPVGGIRLASASLSALSTGSTSLQFATLAAREADPDPPVPKLVTDETAFHGVATPVITVNITPKDSERGDETTWKMSVTSIIDEHSANCNFWPVSVTNVQTVGGRKVGEPTKYVVSFANIATSATFRDIWAKKDTVVEVNMFSPPDQAYLLASGQMGKDPAAFIFSYANLLDFA